MRRLLATLCVYVGLWATAQAHAQACVVAAQSCQDNTRHNLGSRCCGCAEEGGKAELVELRAFVRKGGKLLYELDGLRWRSSYDDSGRGEGPPTGIVTL